MSTSQDNNSDERFALGLLFALITLVVLGVVWFAAWTGLHPKSAAPRFATVVEDIEVFKTKASPAAKLSSVAPAADEARVLIENGVVKFYFATGKADLALGAAEALADVAAGVKAGQRVVVLGYTDSTGNADQNAELAKQRAQAVKQALLALQVAEDSIELRKPEAVENAGSDAQARRVEVLLLK